MVPQITVVSATAFKINQHAAAIERTLSVLPVPAQGLLISNERPTIPFSGDWQPIPKLWIRRNRWTREEYSKFMLFGLPHYIQTNHAITVQWDGFGVNANRWQDEFLDYDYIGAPWPAWMNIGRVGNGGFSMRSKRWIDFAATTLKAPFESSGVNGSEDCYSCTRFRAAYEAAGFKIAPVEMAMRWSLEHPIEEYPRWTGPGSFGFHGFFHVSNLANQLP